MARVRAVLFDAAGTLIETQEPVGETYARLARRHGVSVPASRLEDAFRRVVRGAPPLVFAGAPPERLPELERGWWRERVRSTFRAADAMVRFSDFDAFFDELFLHFAKPEAWRARPGAHAALTGLRRSRRRVGVLSNFDARLRALLRGLGLAEDLECVVLPADAGAAKPDPQIFAAALRRLELSPAEVAYVGDDPEHDLAAARRAGWHAVDVRGLATLAEVPERIARIEEETA